MKAKKETKKDLSRRDFIKTTAVGVGATALAGLGSNEAEAAQPPQRWDKEADVVVVGYGAAGATVAITAHDAGAKVLMLEKAPEGLEGGNASVCGGSIFCVINPKEGIKYLRAMARGTCPEDVLEVLAQGMYENFAWFKTLGTELVLKASANDHPTLPGVDAVHRFEVPIGNRSGAAMFQFLSEQVDKRGIEVWHGTPGKNLIQHPRTGEILGILAERRGRLIYVKADRAVVLTTGGFEFNEEMKSYFYIPTVPIAGRGSPYNTGDGIKMAMAVGADLWHMPIMAAGAASIGIGRLPEYAASSGLSTPGFSFIYINHYGKRFINERRAGSHGLGHSPAFLYWDEELADFPAVPAYIVLDEDVRKAGRLGAGPTSGWLGLKEGFSWSQDNSEEIAKGWIIKADTISELAKKLGIDPATLEKTVNTYNGYCTAGADPDFNRPNATLKPVKTPPYYALELWPVFLNTQGGPKRNKHAQVLHADGRPIPRLYSAGELGSVFGFLYNGGGNIGGDCFAFGRIAGRNAAAETPWS